jgi:hypothetical protein
MPRYVLTAATLVIALTSWSGAAAAQPAPAPAGHWEGAIQIPGKELKIEVDLARAGDVWEGTINIPDQGLKAFPLTAIAVKADTVAFAMKNVPGAPQFSGTVSKDGKQISGDFSQGGGSVPFSLTRTGEPKIERPPNSTPVTSDLVGSWEGTLTVNGTSLRLIVKLANKPGGPGGGTLVSVDQGGVEIPIAAVVQSGTRLKLLVPDIAGAFDGELKEGMLTGRWTQGPGDWPLVLKKQK